MSFPFCTGQENVVSVDRAKQLHPATVQALLLQSEGTQTILCPSLKWKLCVQEAFLNTHLKYPSLWLSEGVCKMTSCYCFLNTCWSQSSGTYLWSSSPREWWTLHSPCQQYWEVMSTAAAWLCKRSCVGSYCSFINLRCCHCCNTSVLCFMVTDTGRKEITCPRILA